MANVSFKKGLLATLPSTYSAGTFYVTTDERAIYLDVSDSSRIRIGDFQEFATVAALEANTNPSTSALYYVSDINCLAKWDGTSYVQINRDTGMTSVEVTGSGNAVTVASYNADGRKLTLTKGATYMTSSDVDSKISTAVGTIPNDSSGNPQTVRQYIDAKTSGIASDASLTALGDRVAAAEGEIDTLQGNAHTHSNKDELDKIASGDKAKWDATSASVAAIKDGESIGSFADVEAALAGKQATGDYATKTEAQGYANEKVASVSAGDGSVTVGGTETAPTVAVKVSQASDNALSLAADGLKVVIPAADEYTIEKAADSGDYASVYALKKNGAQVGASINIPKDMVVQSGSVVENPSGQPAGTYIKLVLQNVADPLYIDVGTLIEYVTSGSVANDMVVVSVSEDHKVTASITDGTITLAKLASSVQTAIGKAHEHSNKTVLDGITSQKVTNWDAAEQNAKDYADGLASNYDEAGAAADALTNAKSYTDGKLEWGSF